MAHSLPATIRFRRRIYPVQGVIKVRKRRYLLLKLLSRRTWPVDADLHGAAARDERWLVVDQRRGGLDGLRTLQILPQRMNGQQLRVLQRLTEYNPYAARLIDSDYGGEETLIVTEWIPGQTLSEWQRRQSTSKRPISLYEAVRLYRGLVNSLCGFHRVSGLVHGDIHPDNLVIGSRSRWLTFIDYGSAWRSLEAVHQRRTQGCRAHWAAPEINAGGPGDMRSDQFSATLVLFTLLAGELPFERLGGKAGHLPGAEAEALWSASMELLRAKRALTRRTQDRIEHFLRTSLHLDSEQRWPTHQKWQTETQRLAETLQCPGPTRPGGIWKQLRLWLAANRHDRK